MVQLTGIAVTLKTADDDPGIEPRLYLGVVGEGGGREFPLNSEYQDFFPGEEEKFALGSIWEGGFTDSETKFPRQSQPGQNNDPAFIPLDLDRVKSVYLRRQSDHTGDIDDPYKLQLLRVVLYGPTNPSRRAFIFDNLDGKNSLWLANDNGHMVYLQEVTTA